MRCEDWEAKVEHEGCLVDCDVYPLVVWGWFVEHVFCVVVRDGVLEILLFEPLLDALERLVDDEVEFRICEWVPWFCALLRCGNAM